MAHWLRHWRTRSRSIALPACRAGPERPVDVDPRSQTLPMATAVFLVVRTPTCRRWRLPHLAAPPAHEVPPGRRDLLCEVEAGVGRRSVEQGEIKTAVGFTLHVPRESA